MSFMKGKFWINLLNLQENTCLFGKSNWERTDTQSCLYCGFMEAGADMRRRSSGREEDDEELQRRRQLQEEQLMKVIITLSSYCF